MKKYVFIILLVLLFSACGRAEEESYEEEIPGQTQNDIANWDDAVNRAFLDDLDYMLYVLENNFALFDVAYWARGVDIYTIVDNIRAVILADPNMDADGFYNALDRHFRPLQHIGHFMIVSPRMHYYFATGAMQVGTSRALVRLRYPHVLAFYEPRHPRAARPLEGILTQVFTAASVPPTNVTTNIIEDGRIAYMSILSFMGYRSFNPAAWERDLAQIFDFYDEIQGFEHLIIDLRANGGGFIPYFLEAVVGPNIESGVWLDVYYFLIYGDYSSEFATPAVLSTIQAGTFNPLDWEMIPIDRMLSDFDLPEFNTADANRIQYGFHAARRISTDHQARFDNQPAFDGQIWLLTGPGTGSAAQVSAWIAKESGFATLVGDTTGGNYGGPRTLVALPNTGILFQMDVFYATDGHGRPLEAGTIPHHFNRPGMDALETTLVLIKETP